MAITPPPQVWTKEARSSSMETANTARREHARMVPNLKMSSKGRTEVQINEAMEQNSEKMMRGFS